jgi:hypothetical protein
VDIETEIRQLKLRADALEATVRTGDPTLSPLRPRRRRRRHPRSQPGDPHTDPRTQVKCLQAELNQDFSALNDEIESFRRHTTDQLTKIRVQTHDQYALILRRLTDMAILLDVLLNQADP